MHYLMYALVNKDEASTSQEARDYVLEELQSDGSFNGEGGRFSSPISDWFVIGGRWSGDLSENTFMKDTINKMLQMEKDADIQIRGCHYGDVEKQEKQAELKEVLEQIYQDALPEEYRGKGLVFDRDTYNSSGYEDDAMIVTEEIWNEIIKPILDNKEEYEVEYDYIKRKNDYGLLEPIVADLSMDGEDLTDKERFVGKKWIVVVDYHN